MKSILIAARVPPILFLGVLFIFVGCARRSVGPSLGLSATTIQLGKVPEGTQKNFALDFRNNGRKPLVISEIRPSCGCTEAHVLSREVAPGDRSKIVGTVNASGESGARSVEIVIKSNDPERPAAKLQLSYLAVRDLDANARLIDAGSVDCGRGFAREITIWAGPGVELQSLVGSPGLSTDWITPTTPRQNQPDILPGSNERRAIVRGSATLPAGPFEGYITVVGKYQGSQITLKTPVVARIAGNLDIAPSPLIITNSLPNTEWRAELRISSRSSRTFSVNSVAFRNEDASVPFIVFRVANSPKGYLIQLRGRSPATGAICRGVVVISADQPAQSELRVPFMILH